MPYTATGNLNLDNHFGKLSRNFFSAKYIPIIWSSHSTPRYLPKKNKSICPYKTIVVLFLIVKNCRESNSSEIKWLDKQIIVCSYNGTCVPVSLVTAVTQGLEPTRLLCPWRFSRQEYWSRLPRPPPGDLPHPGIEPSSLMSPALAGRFFTTNITWEAHTMEYYPAKYQEWTTDKYNMDEYQNTHTRWKKKTKKEYIKHDSIY